MMIKILTGPGFILDWDGSNYTFGVDVADDYLFEGDDFSPGASMDDIMATMNLLGFLSLRPGDTDAEYFNKYTDAQLDFADAYGEIVSMVPYDFENLRQDDYSSEDALEELVDVGMVEVLER